MTGVGFALATHCHLSALRCGLEQAVDLGCSDRASSHTIQAAVDAAKGKFLTGLLVRVYLLQDPSVCRAEAIPTCSQQTGCVCSNKKGGRWFGKGWSYPETPSQHIQFQLFLLRFFFFICLKKVS